MNPYKRTVSITGISEGWLMDLDRVFDSDDIEIDCRAAAWAVRYNRPLMKSIFLNLEKLGLFEGGRLRSVSDVPCPTGDDWCVVCEGDGHLDIREGLLDPDAHNFWVKLPAPIRFVLGDGDEMAMELYRYPRTMLARMILIRGKNGITGLSKRTLAIWSGCNRSLTSARQKLNIWRSY